MFCSCPRPTPPRHPRHRCPCHRFCCHPPPEMFWRKVLSRQDAFLQEALQRHCCYPHPSCHRHENGRHLRHQVTPPRPRGCRSYCSCCAQLCCPFPSSCHNVGQVPSTVPGSECDCAKWSPDPAGPRPPRWARFQQ